MGAVLTFRESVHEKVLSGLGFTSCSNGHETVYWRGGAAEDCPACSGKAHEHDPGECSECEAVERQSAEYAFEDHSCEDGCSQEHDKVPEEVHHAFRDAGKAMLKAGFDNLEWPDDDLDCQRCDSVQRIFHDLCRELNNPIGSL